ncbi:uncharacterized protein LOC115919044 [Strongylocentrotus purpuratus]|uniref:Major facilitator superfamily (MFS) profile domain-containing protein n=1 Tax=Strongylocentrotus purpuratus TaxID=7668 RepID=A0A7M7PNA1_STRPU|nr:uncharacterized protein LOC115919044 [Strongylocentrotus purpuratus]
MDGSEELLLIRRTETGETDGTIVRFRWRVYGLAIITLLNAMNFTQQYLIIVTIFGMANEMKFGDTECRVINETAARDYIGDLNMTGEKLCAEAGRCSENSTLFLPDVCGIQYTGQGTLYDVLAGPIYLIIQGVAAVPLVGLIQSFSLRPPFAIGIITVLWTLCTLITGFVKDYWAVALLRFLYGIFSGPFLPLALGYLTHIFQTEVHTLAFGIGQYGNIAGYGISYLFILVSDSIGWRWCYISCGSAGLILAVASCFMVNPTGPHHQDKKNTLMPSWKEHRASLRQIIWSLMLCIILAQTARIAGMYVVSFNLTVYLAEYFPEFNVIVIGLVTIVIGFPGCIFGGWVCDRLRKVSGIHGRLSLALLLMVLALVFGVLIFQTSLTSLVVLYGLMLFVSDWVYVIILSVISDLTPLECKIVVFAINYFFNHSVAGAINLLVTPLASATSFRSAITLLTGTLFGACFILLLLSFGCMYIKKIKSGQEANQNIGKGGGADVTEKTPLKYSYNGEDKATL